MCKIPALPMEVQSMLSSEQSVDIQTCIKNWIEEALQPLVVHIQSLENKLELIQKKLAEMKQSSQCVKTELSATKEMTTQNQKKLGSALKVQMALLQMEQAQKVLRFQNIPECKDENLKEEMSVLIAPLVQMSKKDFVSEIEQIYRTSSLYIKKNNLPREVFMRFSTKKMRNLILQKMSGQALKINDQVIKVLKHIPFAIRQKRKIYKPLSNLLIKNNIRFRWLIPEGLSFSMKGSYFKITSQDKLKDFMDKQGKEFEELQISQTDDHQEEEDFYESSKENEETEGKDQAEGASAALTKRYTRAQSRRGKNK